MGFWSGFWTWLCGAVCGAVALFVVAYWVPQVNDIWISMHGTGTEQQVEDESSESSDAETAIALQAVEQSRIVDSTPQVQK